MAETFLTPQVVTALVGVGGVVVGAAITAAVQWTLSSKRIEADEKLAERKFEFDKQLAERKFELDARIADRKRKQDLAEEVLVGFYEARDLMKAVRSPFARESEGKTRPRSQDEDAGSANSRDAYYAIIERFEARKEVVANLMSKRFRVVTWFGGDAIKPFDLLQEAITSVIIAAKSLVRNYGTTRISQTVSEKNEETIWGCESDDSDHVLIKIEKSISEIERICRPALEDKILM
ncbi:MAG: hypothetical protein HC829_08150 [Bacteroidales bacterium]|nr:hypothetical protein [Bacteroidales bacterium]